MPPKKTKVLSLTQALSQLLGKTLLPDLQARAEEPAIDAALRQRYEAEKSAERTAESFREFVAHTLEQVAAAWILSCVFVRVLEDRKLLPRNRIAGEDAQDSEDQFFELAPSLTARDYLLTVFEEVASLPGAADVLGPRHNPAFRFSPSNEGARALLDFFRARDTSDALRWQFAGDDTRFLGDLYQDLSEDVRKRYALLQTPGFVEAFILDQTLTPAIEEFGLEHVRVIDPTCGSGHFLLGAFERLLDARLRAAPGVDVRTHALAALDQVYGVDVNPYAVAIARFRLTLAYLSRCGFTRLAQAPKLQLNLVVADSLLHGADKTTLYFAEHESARGDEGAWGLSMFALDDPEEAKRIFDRRYHAVVGNPPYITCKDAKLRDAYRKLYVSCYREYALAAPFAERFFQLAIDGGFVGLINANSFMKREFGSALIEKVLPNIDLTRVIDTAGAYIPGHGTPTVLLFGRNRKRSSADVNAVLGKRGEPTTPNPAEQGLVWRSIADHIDEIGFENDYVTVARVPRTTFDKHPWSLGGGGAAELKELLELRAENRLVDVVDSIGFSVITGEDNVLMARREVLLRAGLDESHMRRNVIGEDVRDWSIADGNWCVWPNDSSGERLSETDLSDVLKYLWPFRTVLKERKVFGRPIEERGLPWWALREVYSDRMRTPLTITFAEVATHNHFVLDRGGKVFKQTAPIIKLPESATEDDHLALLAYLNSSTACFWMKQVCYPKSTHSEARPEKGIPEDNRYAFAGTALREMPIPSLDVQSLKTIVTQVEQLVRDRADCQPIALVRRWLEAPGDVDLKRAIVDAEDRDRLLLHQLVGLQEDLDWLVYAQIGLVDKSDVSALPAAVAIAPNERPFLGSTPPSHLTDRAREVWMGRRASAASNAELRFIEDPVFKRRWWGARGVFASKVATFKELAQDACAELGLEWLEQQLAHHTQPVTVRALVSKNVGTKLEHLLAFAKPDSEPLDAAGGLVNHQALPFLTPLVFTDAGLLTLSAWRHTWILQQREDQGETVNAIPVPRKYDVKDFRSSNYFRLRGKLDVPKERFISYPGCQKDGDDSPLIGWAGWNHLQRAQALIALYQERKLEDGWPKERLVPMLVGLHELMFWLELWHSKPEAGSENPAREVRQYLDAELNAHKLTTSDLESWRPTDSKKPRKSKGKAKAHDA